jgi:hypothetical protein
MSRSTNFILTKPVNGWGACAAICEFKAVHQSNQYKPPEMTREVSFEKLLEGNDITFFGLATAFFMDPVSREHLKFNPNLSTTENLTQSSQVEITFNFKDGPFTDSFIFLKMADNPEYHFFNEITREEYYVSIEKVNSLPEDIKMKYGLPLKEKKEQSVTVQKHLNRNCFDFFYRFYFF